MPELPMLTNEELQTFLQPFSQIPLVSGIETDLNIRLRVEITAGLLQRSYYVIRMFPTLDVPSADALKEQYAQEIEKMAASGLDISQLPVSLEDMRKRDPREFNCFPIWRLEAFYITLGQIQGYSLRAVRYMPDPALSIPSIMFSYEKEGAFPIDVILLTGSLSPKINAVLQRQQALSNEQAAAQAQVEGLEAKIQVPGEERSAGGIILATH